MSRAHLPLTTPSALKYALPLTWEQDNFVRSARRQIEAILEGKDERLLLILGPCSIHDEEAALEYARRLASLQAEVKDSCYLVMRAYMEKPRTTVGWKGFLLDPACDGSCDIEAGLKRARCLLQNITDMGVPVATEFLDPATPLYFDDLISWACIGARTAASATHRQMAASLPMPVGFKNDTEGGVMSAIGGMVSCRQPQVFVGTCPDGKLAIVKASGNSHPHLVLRGGSRGPNYSKGHLEEASSLLAEYGCLPASLVDCAHGNSEKIASRQASVFRACLETLGKHPELPLRGLMLESHLSAGQQQLLHPLRYGVSITDACLSWDETEALVQEAACRCLA